MGVAASNPSGEEEEPSDLFRRNIVDTKHDSKFLEGGTDVQIEVLLPTEKDGADAYAEYSARDERASMAAARYQRQHPDACRPRDYFSTQQILVVEADDTEEVRDIMQDHLCKSTPLKIAKWEHLRRRGRTSSSLLDRQGRLRASFNDLVGSLPARALDANVTVQTKPRQSGNTGPSRCKLCQGRVVGAMYNNYSSREDDAQFTIGEFQRHNMHLVDSMLTAAPLYHDDDQNLFYGQEDQVMTEMTLGDVLSDEGLPFHTFVAQENLFSNRDEDSEVMKAYVTPDGRVNIVGNATNPATLAMLLPWIRVPAFLLPTEENGGEIREINLWLCAKESRTNTHYDGHHNILMVLSGTKIVELSPPDALRGSPVHSDHANHPYLLRCIHVGGHLINEHFSSDTSLYNTGSYNQAARNNIVVSITAGEAIFIPEGWWHRVESSAQCMAINVWFDHRCSSVSAMAHKQNQHMLPYQAREMVRQYFDAHINTVNASRTNVSTEQLLRRHGFRPCLGKFGLPYGGGPAIRQLFQSMSYGSIIPKKRNKEQIFAGLRVIQHHTDRVLRASLSQERRAARRVPSLQLLVLPHAINSLALMINFFMVNMYPSQNGDEGKEDREAILLLLRQLPVGNTDTERRIFSKIIQSLHPETCYNVSVAWEKHQPADEACDSFVSLFERCGGDEARTHFAAQVDAFRNESAKRLILGDLMLLNPEDV